MCYLDFNPQRTAVIQFDFLRSENIINAEGYHVAENALRDDRDTFLHTHEFFEIFDPNAPEQFTRSWFAWANSMFGEMIYRLYEDGRLQSVLRKAQQI